MRDLKSRTAIRIVAGAALVLFGLALVGLCLLDWTLIFAVHSVFRHPVPSPGTPPTRDYLSALLVIPFFAVGATLVVFGVRLVRR